MTLKHNGLLLGLCLAGNMAIAGTMGEACTPGSVTTPCETTGWDVAAQALYLHDRYTGSIPFRAEVIDANNNVTNETYDPDSGWGFKIQGSYHYSTGNDIEVNWYHWDHDFSDTYPQNTGVLDIFSVDHNNKWDAVNIEIAQTLIAGDHKTIRLLAGTQIARLEQNEKKVVISGPGTPLTSPSTINHEFKGAGPRVGFDLTYKLWKNISTYAKSAGSILMGRQKLTQRIFPNAQGAQPSILSFQYSTDIFTSEFDIDLGGKFSWEMDQGVVSLEAGYLWVNYIAPFSSFGRDSNVSYGGPYAGLHWLSKN